MVGGRSCDCQGLEADRKHSSGRHKGLAIIGIGSIMSLVLALRDKDTEAQSITCPLEELSLEPTSTAFDSEASGINDEATCPARCTWVSVQLRVERYPKGQA